MYPIYWSAQPSFFARLFRGSLCGNPGGKKKHVLQEELLKILISNTKKNPFVLAHKLSTLRGFTEDDPLLKDASSKTKTLIYVTSYMWPLLTSQHFLCILIFLKGWWIYIWHKAEHIYHPASTTKQSTWNLTYSLSHYIISLKEAKRYFNKAHCSTTFDLFSVDPELLTPLTLVSDSGGHRSCTLPGVRRQRGRD